MIRLATSQRFFKPAGAEFFLSSNREFIILECFRMDNTSPFNSNIYLKYTLLSDKKNTY